MFQTNPECRKIRMFFWYLLHKKTETKDFDANYFSFYSRRPFPAGNNKKSELTLLTSIRDAERRCTLVMHDIAVHQAERSLLEREIHVDQLSLRFFSLRRAIPCVGFWERKKNQGVKYGLFLLMTQMGFVSFLTWLSTFGNF